MEIVNNIINNTFNTNFNTFEEQPDEMAAGQGLNYEMAQNGKSAVHEFEPEEDRSRE